MKFLCIILSAILCLVTFPVFGQDAIGLASWYGSGRPEEGLNYHTNSWEPFDPTAMACAHRTYPFGTILKVTNLENDKSVHVRVNDRGPSQRYPYRIVDLTREAFRKIAPIDQGKIPVKVELAPYNTRLSDNAGSVKEDIIQKCTQTVRETFLKSLLSCLSYDSIKEPERRSE